MSEMSPVSFKVGAGRGHYQKQLAALVSAANAEKLQLEDILPDSFKAHFQEMSELERAREYVKELEERENTLQANNEDLTKSLHEKQKEIDDAPMEHESRRVELRQTQRQVELYKEMYENSSARAERYHEQLSDALERERAVVSASEKTQDLNIYLDEQQAVIRKLIDKNRKLEQQRGSDLETLRRKDKQLEKKDEMLAELRQQVDSTADESMGLHEENIHIKDVNLELMEKVDVLTKEIDKMKMACASDTVEDHKSQLFAAAISEIKTLSRFHSATFTVIDCLAKAFNEAKGDFPSAAHISNKLEAAQDALAGYSNVKQVVRPVLDGPSYDADQIALYTELDSLGDSAADSMISLEILNTNFWCFLSKLSNDPKLLSTVNAALCNVDRPRVTPMYIGN